ncbi:MAG: PEP-CTERM sorting domain-containing protein [Gemmataceae bacterium]|nr:PEP-CTERM sorting domain-containing protein [Gemmataceae bacterium]
MAVAAVLAAAGPAPGFYWKGWPGSGTRPEPTIVPPTNDRPPTDRPKPPTDEPWFPPIDEPPPPPPPPPPEQLPEPGTITVGLIGLGTLAVVRRLRRK